MDWHNLGHVQSSFPRLRVKRVLRTYAPRGELKPLRKRHRIISVRYDLDLAGAAVRSPAFTTPADAVAYLTALAVLEQ